MRLMKYKSKDHNKHCPDITISKCGLEYDMAEAPIKAYFLSERLAETTNKHETLKDYDNELARLANYIPQREHNQKLEHARSVKVDRHRDMLPQLLF